MVHAERRHAKKTIIMTGNKYVLEMYIESEIIEWHKKELVCTIQLLLFARLVSYIHVCLYICLPQLIISHWLVNYLFLSGF